MTGVANSILHGASAGPGSDFRPRKFGGSLTQPPTRTMATPVREAEASSSGSAPAEERERPFEIRPQPLLLLRKGDFDCAARPQLGCLSVCLSVCLSGTTGLGEIAAAIFGCLVS